MKLLYYFIVAALLLFVVLTLIMIAIFNPSWFPFLEYEKLTILSPVLAAFGTVLLAIAAAMTIWHSSKVEKYRKEEELVKQHRLRMVGLLNEIGEWATDINKCGVEITSVGLSRRKDIEQGDKDLFSHIPKWKSNFENMVVKNRYVNSLVDELPIFEFGEIFTKSVKNLIRDFDNIVKFLRECDPELFEDFKKKADQLIGLKIQLDTSAMIVVEQVASQRIAEIETILMPVL